MEKIDIHSIDVNELLENTTKVIYAFRVITNGQFGRTFLSEIQEDFILCSLKDIPESLQEAFVYKCILEKHRFKIQIIPNSLKAEPLSKKEVDNLFNKINK